MNQFFMTVDDLHQCSKAVGEDDEHIFASKLSSNSSAVNPSKKIVVKPRRYFPFKQGYLAVSTMRIGAEGIQMSVNGKQITSFAFREVFSMPQCSFSKLQNLRALSNSALGVLVLFSVSFCESRHWSHGLLMKPGFQVTLNCSLSLQVVCQLLRILSMLLTWSLSSLLFCPFIKA